MTLTTGGWLPFLSDRCKHIALPENVAGFVFTGILEEADRNFKSAFPYLCNSSDYPLNLTAYVCLNLAG